MIAAIWMRATIELVASHARPPGHPATFGGRSGICPPAANVRRPSFGAAPVTRRAISSQCIGAVTMDEP
ncbi:MAG: hypothetical protein V9E89_11055 [Ilumatobacteraceae bacterium]